MLLDEQNHIIDQKNCTVYSTNIKCSNLKCTVRAFNNFGESGRIIRVTGQIEEY